MLDQSEMMIPQVTTPTQTQDQRDMMAPLLIIQTEAPKTLNHGSAKPSGRNHTVCASEPHATLSTVSSKWYTLASKVYFGVLRQSKQKNNQSIKSDIPAKTVINQKGVWAALSRTD